MNYSYQMKKIAISSIGLIDESLTGTTTPSQSEPRSNSDKGVLNSPQSSRTGASSPDAV